MSIHAMSMVLDFAPPEWGSGTRLVALALADRVGDNWECWPSVSDLSKRTGLSTRQVRSHLDTLEQEGVVVRQPRRRPNGTQQSNLWIWLWRHEVAPARRVKPTSGGRVKPTSPPT